MGTMLVEAGKYIFQAADNPAYGLYYNKTNRSFQYVDFPDSVNFSIDTETGNGFSKGNLGIGMLNPSYGLDVSGASHFAGRLQVGNDKNFATFDSLGNLAFVGKSTYSAGSNK